MVFRFFRVHLSHSVTQSLSHSVSVRVSDRTRLQVELFISVNTPFTRGFWAKIPVYESCAAGLILGNFGQFWAFRGCFCINTPFTRVF
jgi:hypothetical protein